MNTLCPSQPRTSVFNPMLQVALTANLFEWYEMALIGYMALEIGKLFFPAATEHTSLILSFSVFALSFLIRPLGGIFFGTLGNKYGTSTALKISLIAMAVPAVLIAFLPTYQIAGYWATGSLIVLKMVQGLAAGGEGPIASYYVAMNVSGKNRGFYCATVISSQFLGLLLASFVVFALPFVAAKISAWAPTLMHGYIGETWRWPFLLTIPLSLWIFKARSSIPQTATKLPIQTKLALNSRPLTPLIQAWILVAFMAAQIYMVFFWMPSYLHSYVGMPLSEARAINVMMLTAIVVLRLLAGYSLRWIAEAKLTFFAICASSLLSYPLFMVLQHGRFWEILLVQLVFVCCEAALAGLYLQLPDLFKNNWQNLGMACADSIPKSIFGGTAPLVCSFLIAHTHLLTAPALYLTFMGMLALPVAYRLAFPKQQKKAAADSGYAKSAYAQ